MLAGILARRNQFFQDAVECLLAEIARGSFAFEVVVGIAEEGEVRAVLLEVVPFRIDDRDCFLRVSEDLLIECGVQLDRASARLSSRFSRRSLNRHGNAPTKGESKLGGLPGTAILTQHSLHLCRGGL